MTEEKINVAAIVMTDASGEGGDWDFVFEKIREIATVTGIAIEIEADDLWDARAKADEIEIEIRSRGYGCDIERVG